MDGIKIILDSENRRIVKGDNQLAIYLNRSGSCIQKWRCSGLIPESCYLKIGKNGRVAYFLDEVDKLKGEIIRVYG